MWLVVDVSSITPHFKDLGKYISSMERAGYELKFVDQGTLYFKKS